MSDYSYSYLSDFFLLLNIRNLIRTNFQQIFNTVVFSVLDRLAPDGPDVPSDQAVQGGDEHRPLLPGN